jgi:iron(III) transport system ATP-binding protein
MAELILDGISKYYGDTTVINEVSLSVEPGQFVALLGPSGCGKTTVLRCIAGFEQLDAGRILLGKKTLSSKKKQIAPEQRQMSMVFQSYALWPHMNVMDNVGYALKLKGINGTTYKRQINEALDAVNMQHLLNRMPSELSGGQRQRVALARCLVSAPKVILLDEPLANLDRHLRASMEQIFRDFHQRSATTFIYVTHDQAEAMALADKVAVMNHGQIVQCDSPETLYNYPETEWTAQFIGQGSILYCHTIPKGNGRVLSGADIIGALKSRPGDSQTLSNTNTHAILIRPQHIRLLNHDDAHSSNLRNLTATVTERVFKGERYHYQAIVASKQPLDFYHEQKLHIGQTLQLTIDKGYLLRR